MKEKIKEYLLDNLIGREKPKLFLKRIKKKLNEIIDKGSKELLNSGEIISEKEEQKKIQKDLTEYWYRSRK